MTMPADNSDWEHISAELSHLHARVSETERRLDAFFTALKVLAIMIVGGGGIYWAMQALY